MKKGDVEEVGGGEREEGEEKRGKRRRGSKHEGEINHILVYLSLRPTYIYIIRN